MKRTVLYGNDGDVDDEDDVECMVVSKSGTGAVVFVI